MTSDALVKCPQDEEDSECQMSLTANTNKVSSKMALNGLTCPVSTNPDFTFVAVFSLQILGTYPMAAEKRGICLIINNYDFTKTHLQKREGTMVDEGELMNYI